jgi:hypothetical protein
MAGTITIEIPATSEALVRRLLTLHEELQALALSAPDGTVLDACETTVVERGRELCKQVLAEAVAGRIEVAEKRGRRSAPAPADEPKRTAGPSPASS